MKNVIGQGQVSNQSGTSWYPVITANSFKVAVLIMSLFNYVTAVHKHHKTTQTPHKTSPGKGLKSNCSFSCFIWCRFNLLTVAPRVSIHQNSCFNLLTSSVLCMVALTVLIISPATIP